MTRIGLLLVLLPLWALAADVRNPLSVNHPNTLVEATVNGISQTVTIPLTGQNTVSMTVPNASTIACTITPFCVFHATAGDQTQNTNFISNSTGAKSGSQTLASGGGPYSFGINVCPGATSIQVKSAASLCTGSGVVSLNASYSGNYPLVDLAVIDGAAILSAGRGGILPVGGGDANNAAIVSNPLLTGAEAQSGQPTAATTGNLRQLVASLDGQLYVRHGGPINWTCGLNALGTTRTQCQAAPGANVSLYVTSILAQSSTTTAGQFTVTSGTGANCATTNNALLAGSTAALYASPANTSAPAIITFQTPLKLATNTELCALGVATNLTELTVVGFTAP